MDEADNETRVPGVQDETVPRRGRTGPLGYTALALAIIGIVSVVFYGMTREPAQEQSASAPTTATPSPAGPPAATTGQGGAQGGQPAQQSQPGAPQSGDTGTSTAGSDAKPAPRSQETTGQPAPKEPPAQDRQ